MGGGVGVGGSMLVEVFPQGQPQRHAEVTAKPDYVLSGSRTWQASSTLCLLIFAGMKDIIV